MEISAKLVKELREKTGCSLGECKKALKETDGDLDKASIFLREKGLADASKKSGRATKEGMVIAKISEDGKKGILLEINCETDFVARNDAFQEAAHEIADQVMADESITCENCLKDKMDKVLKEQIAKMGENMTFGKFYRAPAQDSMELASYIHAGGKIGVLAGFTYEKPETAKNETFIQMAKNICMQIAALPALGIKREDADPSVVKEQEDIFKKQLQESGKPEKIWDKILTGKMDKFYAENCLLEMQYVKDSEQKITVGEYITNTAKELGDTLSIHFFKRIQLGESE